MRIRTFTLDDHDAARRLWDAADHLGPVPPHEVETKLRRDPELFLVADDGGRVVGTVMGAFDGRRGWIYRLAVDPTRQREGIAGSLVRELEVRMGRLGVTRVNLLVMADNAGGRAFWEAVGYGAHEPVVLHSKALTAAEAALSGAGRGC
jgi:ribosomal protein S18 acetylase RimI-like enzyme